MKFFKKQKYPRHLEEEQTFGQQALIFFWEAFKVVVISLAIIVPVRFFLIKPFYVKGASMEPNFHDREYLIVDEITYRFNHPERGEVIVFKDPFNSGQFFIKRVIGLPGEKVRITDGRVFISEDGSSPVVALEEDYLLPATATNGNIEFSLDVDEYFLLGDNRNSSLDSRAFGPLEREAIVGRVLWRGWPLNKVGFLIKDIDYNL